MEPIQVLILHKSRLIRETLALALENFDRFSVITDTPSVSSHFYQEILKKARNVSPDLIMLDLNYPFRTGLSDARNILEDLPSARIIMIGLPLIESEIMACIETGVAGCELEDVSLPDLVEDINAVYTGENRCSPQITKLLFLAVSSRARPHQLVPMLADARLTPRELDVTELIERGFCNKEIAVNLGIEVQTVKNHVHNILDKLHLRRRQDAASYAREFGLLKGIKEIRESKFKSTST